AATANPSSRLDSVSSIDPSPWSLKWYRRVQKITTISNFVDPVGQNPYRSCIFSEAISSDSKQAKRMIFLEASMIETSGSVFIQKDPAAVFAFISELDKYPLWQSGLLEVTYDKPITVGARAHGTS